MADGGGYAEAIVSAALTWGPVVLTPVALALAWRVRVIGPGSRRELIRRDVGDVSPVVWVGACLLVLIVPGLLTHLAMSMTMDVAASRGLIATPSAEEFRREALGSGFASLVGVIVACAVVGQVARRTPRARVELARRAEIVPALRQGLVALAIILPVATCAGVVATLLARLVTGETPPPIAHDMLALIADDPTSPWTLVLIASAVVGAPIVEEVTYRALLQSGVRSMMRRPWPAIIVTGLVFGVMHAGVAAWHALIPLIVLGVALGAAFERTGRLLVPIVVHAGFNAFNIGLALLSR